MNNKEPLPFVYESTGIITRFTDGRDPKPRSREVFIFHRPETMAEWLSKPTSLRSRLQTMPPLGHFGLRDCQITAIDNLEQSFKDDRPRALFMRDVKSRNYFEQMKGRGTRTLDHDHLKKVTPSGASSRACLTATGRHRHFAALRCDGIEAPCVFDGPINGEGVVTLLKV